MTIGERFRTVSGERAGDVAVVDGEERITYGELASRTLAIVQHLSMRMGVGQGDLIAAALPNRWEFVAGFLAAAELGAVFLPLNPNWREELRTVSELLGPAAVMTDQAHAGAWERATPGIAAERILVVDAPGAWKKAVGDKVPPGRHDDGQRALYLMTSGSTGRPRVVPRTHRMLLAGARNVARALGISTGQRFLGVIPFHHANGFSNSMLLPLMNGGTVVLMERFVPARLLETVVREGIEVLIGSPFLFSMLAEQEVAPGALQQVKICLSSGAPLPAALKLRCRDQLGLDVRQLYGSTETGVISIERPGSEPVEGSVGMLIDEVELRILEGEFAVRGPATMPGYVGEPELNREAFRDGFFRTGDLGSVDSHGNLMIRGRVKRMINAGGVKVDPVEIENILLMLPAVRQCRVEGSKDNRATELIKARVAFRPGQPHTRAEIVEHCRAHLAEYKIPRIIEVVDEIEVDLAGKSPVRWSEEK